MERFFLPVFKSRTTKQLVLYFVNILWVTVEFEGFHICFLKLTCPWTFPWASICFLVMTWYYKVLEKAIIEFINVPSLKALECYFKKNSDVMKELQRRQKPIFVIMALHATRSQGNGGFISIFKIDLWSWCRSGLLMVYQYKILLPWNRIKSQITNHSCVKRKGCPGIIETFPVN